MQIGRGSALSADSQVETYQQYHSDCMSKIRKGVKPQGWCDGGIDMWKSVFKGLADYPDQHYVGSPLKIDGISVGSFCVMSLEEEQEMELKTAVIVAEAAEKMGKIIEHISQPYVPVGVLVVFVFICVYTHKYKYKRK